MNKMKIIVLRRSSLNEPCTPTSSTEGCSVVRRTKGSRDDSFIDGRQFNNASLNTNLGQRVAITFRNIALHNNQTHASTTNRRTRREKKRTTDKSDVHRRRKATRADECTTRSRCTCTSTDTCLGAFDKVNRTEQRELGCWRFEARLPPK